MTTQLRTLALPALLALVMGCVTEPDADLPEGAVAMQASEQYRSWWGETEACSRLSGSFSRIEWYVVPGVASFPTDEGEKVGIRIQSGDRTRIVLAETYAAHPMVVRHEMLHALLQRSGHPVEYFETRCRLTWQLWNEDHGAQAAQPGLS